MSKWEKSVWVLGKASTVVAKISQQEEAVKVALTESRNRKDLIYLFKLND